MDRLLGIGEDTFDEEVEGRDRVDSEEEMPLVCDMCGKTPDVEVRKLKTNKVFDREGRERRMEGSIHLFHGIFENHFGRVLRSPTVPLQAAVQPARLAAACAL